MSEKIQSYFWKKKKERPHTFPQKNKKDVTWWEQNGKSIFVTHLQLLEDRTCGSHEYRGQTPFQSTRGTVQAALTCSTIWHTTHSSVPLLLRHDSGPAWRGTYSITLVSALVFPWIPLPLPMCVFQLPRKHPSPLITSSPSPGPLREWPDCGCN